MVAQWELHQPSGLRLGLTHSSSWRMVWNVMWGADVSENIRTPICDYISVNLEYVCGTKYRHVFYCMAANFWPFTTPTIIIIIVYDMEVVVRSQNSLPSNSGVIAPSPFQL